MMEKRLFIISKVALLALVLFVGQACQEKYDMVDPPFVTEDDDLDEEDMLKNGLENYFVTPYGEGSMDGSSWENAMDLAAFRTLVTGTISLAKSSIHLSQGKYLMSDEIGQGLLLRKDIQAIYGGYNQFSEGVDTSDRDVARYVTTFSGDVNANKKADAGDCSLLVVKKGHVVVDGITFQYGYAAASETAFSSGIYLSGDVTNTIIELHNCVVRDCVSAVTGSTTQGGAAIFNYSGQARLENVQLLNNNSEGRGGAIRCQTANAILMLNRCLLKGNSLNTMWGSAIQLSAGHTCINNSTFLENNDPARSTTLNGGGSFLMINNTLVGYGNVANMGVFRCETSIGDGSVFINNVIVSQNASMLSVNGNNKDVTSKGYNVYQSTTGITMASTDVVCSNFSFGVFNDDGTYRWDMSQLPEFINYATKQALITTAQAFNPQKSPLPNLGALFLEWMGEDALTVDQRGESRNPDKMQPGAYDAGLK